MDQQKDSELRKLFSALLELQKESQDKQQRMSPSELASTFIDAISTEAPNPLIRAEQVPNESEEMPQLLEERPKFNRLKEMLKLNNKY